MSTSDLFALDGKVAVVTGGTSGIGRMIADGLVDAGMRVYVASRQADPCARVAGELSERGTCVGLPADLSTQDGCRALAAGVAEREAAVDLLVNNAGATWGAPLEEYPDAAFDKALATIKAAGLEILAADKAAGRIEAVATTFWFGFKDDVVIRLRKKA